MPPLTQPPGTVRTWNSSLPSSDGGRAGESLRSSRGFWGTLTSTYCPGVNGYVVTDEADHREVVPQAVMFDDVLVQVVCVACMA